LGWTAATVASIWASVAIISVFAPDMISGIEQQRMPIAAFTTWLWGLGGSVASLVPMARLRTDVGRRAFWIMLSGATMAIWAVHAGERFRPDDGDRQRSDHDSAGGDDRPCRGDAGDRGRRNRRSRRQRTQSPAALDLVESPES